MRAICTYCSAEKDPAPDPLPALQRYRSRRITDLAAAAAAGGDAFLILSGKFGLIEGVTPLPWYDHLLREDEVDAMVDRAATALSDADIHELAYHTADPGLVPEVRPYLRTINRACVKAGASLKIVILPGAPD